MIKILHVMRSPVGGLFRHVLDLAREQIAHGCEVGIVCDHETGGKHAMAIFNELAPSLALGIHRLSMPRLPGGADVIATLKVRRIAVRTGADILHGHGAKGGAYARLATMLLAGRSCFYTPHGGTLHYDPKSPQGRIFFAFERFSQKATNAILFESYYGLGVFRRKIGEPTCPATVVHNGVSPSEFIPVETTGTPLDLLFIGELRDLKGVGTLLDALADLKSTDQAVRCLIVGNGPGETRFKNQAADLGLTEFVTFRNAMPAREAFTKARAVVVPSWNESLPYVVLEAGAAGLPMVATTVGGIPEIFGGEAHRLVPSKDAGRLANAIAAIKRHPKRALVDAETLRQSMRSRFSVAAMAEGVLQAYAEFGNLTGSKGHFIKTALENRQPEGDEHRKAG